MNILSLVFAFALTISTAGAQSATFKGGPELTREFFEKASLHYKDFLTNRNAFHAKSLLYDQQGNVQVGFGPDDGSSYNFLILENYITPKTLQSVPLKDHDPKLSFFHLFSVDNRPFFLLSGKERDKHQNTIFVQELGLGSTLEGSPRPLFSISDEKKGSEIEASSSANDHYTVIYQLSDGKRSSERQVSCYVINKKLEKVWQGEISLGSKESDTSVNSVNVDDDGNVYVMYTVGDPAYRDSRKEKLAARFWRLDKSLILDIGRDDPDADSDDAMFKIIDGVTPVVGVVSYLKKEYSYQAFQIDPAKGVSQKIIHHVFTSEEVKTLAKSSWQEGLAFQDLEMFDDGSFVLTIEPRRTFSYSNGVSYQAGRCLLVGGKDDKIAWTKIINKLQETSFGRDIGHKLIKYNHNIIMLYNDDRSNLSLPNSSVSLTTWHGRNTVIMMQIISNDGTVTEGQIDMGEAARFGFCPGMTVRINENLLQLSLVRLELSKWGYAFGSIQFQP